MKPIVFVCMYWLHKYYIIHLKSALTEKNVGLFECKSLPLFLSEAPFSDQWR